MIAFDLTGLRALVIGASRGIGFAIADRYAEAGAGVAICARTEGMLEEARARIARHGRPVHAIACDAAEKASLEAAVSEAAIALGGLDILVNNASGKASGNTEEDWQAVIAVDLMATQRACRAALPHLEKSDRAAIINLSSRSALQPSPHSEAYGAAKAGLIHFTQSHAARLARKRIRVNCIAPGSTDFPGGWWDGCRTANAELYRRTEASIPFGRFGQPDDVADVALFLASPFARWITGQTILVDGGQTLAV
ncbi:SDR family NAD(P)-dependent oxidoreductase [Terrarubrum flagellatum]|uniref:SDR family NAD(P)-dependent oxidoreductase n=1 Tax=Terrirubrum flagellatum TaxID=2895980 RepID=UPI003144E517